MSDMTPDEPHNAPVDRKPSRDCTAHLGIGEQGEERKSACPQDLVCVRWPKDMGNSAEGSGNQLSALSHLKFHKRLTLGHMASHSETELHPSF